MRKILIIGGGASGLIAGYFAKNNDTEVTIAEKNEKLGKKMYITGKGRCNFTNDTSAPEFLEHVVTNPKFLYTSIYSFPPQKTKDFLSSYDLKIKTERGNRVFPESDKASDVTKTIEKALKERNVKINLNSKVDKIIVDNKKVVGAIINGKQYDFDAIIVCTGGISYPLTGSTGDGYKFAKEVGINVIRPKPALCGINLKGDFYKKLQGLSLKNVSITACVGEKVVFSEFGEMLFTHFGISGPIVLSCSSIINKYQASDILLSLDLKPALSEEILEKRLIREFCENGAKTVRTVLRSLLPISLIEEVAIRSNISLEKTSANITSFERKNIIKTLKNFTMKPNSLRDIEESIITSGGIDVKEINPKTMESKKISGLFFAGEVIDVDAYTGGFNMQIAFSTGYIAGINASKNNSKTKEKQEDL